MRLAWFTPLPPLRTGIAAYSAELLCALAERQGETPEALLRAGTGVSNGELPMPVRLRQELQRDFASPVRLRQGLRRDFASLDVYVDSNAPRPSVEVGWPIYPARDFVWQNTRQPYDLVVYQLGNSPAHDYMWPYLVRFPGLVVLHDAQLHHSRALSLLTRGRHDDYRAEFVFCHPDARPGVADAVISATAGFLFYIWPLVRVPIDSARTVAVHTPGLASLLGEQFPGQEFDVIRMGVADPGDPEGAQATASRGRVCARHGVAPDALLFAAYGMATPEKRLPEILRGLRAVRASDKRTHLLIVGDIVGHYDVRADASALGVADSVTITGYVSDADLTDYLHAADVALSLRWPSSRETSAAWLRCMAAGKPTVITDLVHNGHIPALDPRTWQRMETTSRLTDSRTSGLPDSRRSRLPDSRTPGLPDFKDPICIAIDILDEQHSLGLAMRGLAADPDLRTSLGRAARRYWRAHHTVEQMADDYRRVLARAAARPVPDRSHLPAHVLRDASEQVRDLLAPFGVGEDQLRWKVEDARLESRA